MKDVQHQSRSFPWLDDLDRGVTTVTMTLVMVIRVQPVVALRRE